MNVFVTIDTGLLILETVVKVSLTFVVGAIVARLLRNRYPSAAHLTWVLAFSVALVVPLVAPSLPANNVFYLNLRPPTVAAPKTPAVPATTAIFPPSPVEAAGPASGAGSPEAQAPYAQPTLWQNIMASSILRNLFLLWLTGFLFIVSRSLLGLYTLRVIRRFGTTSDGLDDLAIVAEQSARRIGCRQRIELRLSTTPELPMPMTWGVLRPTIILPWDAEQWSKQRFEATMLHELSHVRRRDFLCQLVAEFVCALHWFNPLAWFAARTMRSDAELAADEAVIRSGLKPSDYASELLRLAADLGRRPVPFATLGTPAMTHSKIESRLESILAPAAGKRGMTTLHVLASAVIAVLVVPGLAALHASSKAQTPAVSNDERTVAMQRLKQVALATLMYSEDADMQFPYVQQTASAIEVLQPYARSREIFQSPTKGGKFLFNMNLAGVEAQNIPEPANMPMWIEQLPDPKLRVAVAFSDGHAKLFVPDAMSVIKKAAAQHLTRSKSAKPLPPNYLLPIKP